MVYIPLICLLIAMLLFIPVFGYRKGSRGLKIALLIVADILMVISHNTTSGETTGSDSGLNNSNYLLNYMIFTTLNVLAIYKIFSKISSNQELYDKWHKDPENWKAGIFYYNPEDKRMFPPKRIAGMGWTINFANPYSLLAYALMFLIVFAAIKYFGF
jgi:uncharacterized membrane protein